MIEKKKNHSRRRGGDVTIRKFDNCIMLTATLSSVGDPRRSRVRAPVVRVASGGHTDMKPFGKEARMTSDRIYSRCMGGPFECGHDKKPPLVADPCGFRHSHTSRTWLRQIDEIVSVLLCVQRVVSVRRLLPVRRTDRTPPSSASTVADALVRRHINTDAATVFNGFSRRSCI